MLPEGSEGSTARALTLPVLLSPAIAAGPTGVQLLVAATVVAFEVKIRKSSVARSATGSPNPVPETARVSSSAQLLSVAAKPEVLVISSV